MGILYKYILKPIAFLFPPDFVHTIFVSFGEISGRFYIGRLFVRFLYGKPPAGKQYVVDGITYKSRVLLSAGFDPDGQLVRILSSVGFGGEEVGSVTARYCEGNPKPRLTRLKQHKSIVVFKGLRNKGVDALISKIKKTPHEDGFVVGISIARTNDQKSGEVDSGIADYLYSYKRLNEEGVGDYYTINISCPNSFSGECFLEPVYLEKLLTVLSEIPTEKPVYIKMPINKTWSEIEALLEVVKRFDFVKGIVIGNLNKNYSTVDKTERPKNWRGGLSGKPCGELSTEYIRNIKQTYGERFTIIGCGGIFSVADAQKKIDAGADLLQLITGMIFEGPQIINEINRVI